MAALARCKRTRAALVAARVRIYAPKTSHHVRELDLASTRHNVSDILNIRIWITGFL
jgi:hypothetical protein